MPVRFLTWRYLDPHILPPSGGKPPHSALLNAIIYTICNNTCDNFFLFHPRDYYKLFLRVTFSNRQFMSLEEYMSSGVCSINYSTVRHRNLEAVFVLICANCLGVSHEVNR